MARALAYCSTISSVAVRDPGPKRPKVRGKVFGPHENKSRYAKPSEPNNGPVFNALGAIGADILNKSLSSADADQCEVLHLGDGFFE